MTLQAIHSLQTALYSALSNDTALMAEVTGIYDYVPENATYPYLAITIREARAQDNAALRGLEATVRLSGYSDEKGSKNVQDILALAHHVLVSANLVLSGFTVIDVAWQSSLLNRRSDGLVYAGECNYKIRVISH